MHTGTSRDPADSPYAGSKVPRVILAFWIVKIFATTVGETGGDALSMTLKLGYAVSTVIFLAFFLITLTAQVRSSRYHPLWYWLVVVATTTVGTTTSDMLDRTFGLGYIKSSIIELALVILVLVIWHRSTGSISVDRITTRRNEIFYWLTILVSNTLGTALGDFVADSAGMGFERGALVFAGLIVLVAAARFLTPISKAVLFWAAYVLTRPLGATLGDLLTKPHAEGGLNFGRITSSLVIAVGMVLLISVTSLRRRAPKLVAAALFALGAFRSSTPLVAQQPGLPVARYGLGTWNADSFGNHRALVRVRASAPAVHAFIPWRRRDEHPEAKRIIVVTASGVRIRNSLPLNLTRESGDVAFEPTAGPGDYYVYYMPYQGSIRSNYPRITYQAPDSTADVAWIERAGFPTRGDRTSAMTKLPKAELVEIQAVDSMNRMDPMEVVATAAEVTALRTRYTGSAFVLFPEDRTRAIRMTDDLPYRWITTGGNGPVIGVARPGEFYAFQAGVWALQDLDSVDVTFSALQTADGRSVIPASAFRSFDTRGVDWQGHAFTRRLRVSADKVQALWAGVMVPAAAVGRYTGTISVRAAGVAPRVLPVQLNVAGTTIPNHGDDEPWRLSRLRWLDSRARLDTTLVAPYTPVRVRGTTLSVLGRTVQLAPTGLPSQITSYFSDEMTSIVPRGRAMLAGPVSLVAESGDGRPLAWEGTGARVTRSLPGAALWQATSRAGPLAMHTEAQLDFDGNIEYRIALTATAPTSLRDVRLEIPFRGDVARYFMGLNRKGGIAPESYDWTWDVKRNQDAAWIGDVNVGLQFTLTDDRYIRPLNTNFYQLRPLVMPRSWENGGKGGCRFRAERAVYRATCYSGARTITPGDTAWYNLRLLVTPFHTLDPRTHFSTRYFHRYAPIDSIRQIGANVVNVHHATAVNPFINYPFLRPDAMKAYADSAHAAAMRMKVYYTVRELTYRAPELWALRSFGDEVFASGPGGGHSWLQEHIGSDYIQGWVVPELHDIALVTSGISRWHNFYVEGLEWLVDQVGIDGLYLDDVAFDRTSMQRIRRVLASKGAPGERIDLHSANQFNPNDGFASSANLYLEHFPYIDRLWFGEYFDYQKSPSDYWLVEISGIPFGLMGEMLQDGGNPWRGMVFGMTNRLPWTGGDPRSLWKAWDAFGIADARMVGWWARHPPVQSGRPEVLATSYIRKGRTMVALASWAADTMSVGLTVDWAALGLDSASAKLNLPAIAGFQQGGTLRPGDRLAIEPGKGRIVVIEGRAVTGVTPFAGPHL